MSAGRVAASASATALAWALAGVMTAGEASQVQEPAGAAPQVQEPPAAAAPAELTPEQEARVRALEGELRCPVCRSQSIRQSRSFMADDMRVRIRTMVAEGRSDDEIRQYFVDRYGTWVLLTPPKKGFNLAAYYLPALVVMVGALGLAFAARRWSRRPRGAALPAPPPPSPQLTRLERELEETE